MKHFKTSPIFLVFNTLNKWTQNNCLTLKGVEMTKGRLGIKTHTHTKVGDRPHRIYKCGYSRGVGASNFRMKENIQSFLTEIVF